MLNKLVNQLVNRLGKTVLHTCSDLFKLGQNFSHRFPPVPTCSHLFTQTCSQFFTPVHNCSYLFTPVHTCSHLFTPQWLSMLFAQWQFLIEFSPCESCYFLILSAILLKLHIFAHLIESYPTVYNLSGCIEIKLSIPQAAHTTVTMYARCKLSISALWNALILQSYVLSCWNCLLNSPNQELSNIVRVMELYWNRNVGPSRSQCLMIVNGKRFEHCTF